MSGEAAPRPAGLARELPPSETPRRRAPRPDRAGVPVLRAAGPLGLLSAEWCKIQSTWILPLTVLGPLGVTILGFVYFLLRPDYVRGMLAKGAPPFAVIMNAMSVVHIFSLMLGTALLASMLVDVEHRSDTWKQLFSMPVSRAGTYVAKYVLLALLLAVASVLTVAGYGAVWLWQGFGAFPWADFARAATLPYLAVLPLAALQLAASSAAKNQAAPLTAGILGTMFSIGGMPMPGWVPWTMPRHALFVVFGKPLQYAALWQAVAVEVVVVVAVGALLLSRRDIR